MTHAEMKHLMDFLVSHRAPDLPPSALADVFDRLIWCLADQGTGLLQVRDSWLESGDRDRVEVALAMNETYPFNEAEEMEAALTRIAARWPDLEPRCRELVESRRMEGV